MLSHDLRRWRDSALKMRVEDFDLWVEAFNASPLAIQHGILVFASGSKEMPYTSVLESALSADAGADLASLVSITRRPETPN
jgi:hypothetical protein